MTATENTTTDIHDSNSDGFWDAGTTYTDVYQYLENLQGVRVNEATRQTITAVRELVEQVRPTVERARRLIGEHEAHSQLVRSQIIENMETLGEPADVEQGLWDLMQELSGARGLWTAMAELSGLCDPDSVSLLDIEQSRAAMS